MRTAQNGRCLICGEGSRRLEIDHCHTTGRVRGLLCIYCNTGLGRFKDNPALLARAIAYLTDHSSAAKLTRPFPV